MSNLLTHFIKELFYFSLYLRIIIYSFSHRLTSIYQLSHSNKLVKMYDIFYLHHSPLQQLLMAEIEIKNHLKKLIILNNIINIANFQSIIFFVFH